MHGDDSEQRLEAEAVRFAEELTLTVRAVVGEPCPPFQVSSHGVFVAVAQGPNEGIVLCREGKPLVRLEAEYDCEWDRSATYLKVLNSRISLFPSEESETVPLFRYEYDRKGSPNLPDAHLHVHDDPTHHSRLATLMNRAGKRSRRSRARVRKGTAQRSDFHFPLGGDRFRPTLEDVLHVLVEELGVDKIKGWHERLAFGRSQWRERQLASAVRDSPEIAAKALEELEYTVAPPGGKHPPTNTERLHAL